MVTTDVVEDQSTATTAACRAEVRPGLTALLEGQNTILELIAKNAPLDLVLIAIAHLIESQAPETLCSILMVRDNRLRHGAAPSLPPAYNAAVEGLEIGPCVGSCGTSAFLRKPVIVTDIATDPLWADHRDFVLSFGLRACWSTPIFATDSASELLGTFAIYTLTPSAPTKFHYKLIDVATQMTRIAIERHRADERLLERAAQLAEADRRKDEFIALLAHELRNPLAPILMALEVLRLRHNDRATVEKYRSMLDRQVHHLKRLIDDLVDVARITRGKLELKKEHTTVDAFCSRAIELTAPAIEARHHRLHVALAEPPLAVDADPVRMAQVVSNVINNASVYSPPESDIFLSVRRENAMIVIRVKDTGIGMTRETLERAFELFAQGDPSREREQGGLGVGLALVRRIVELHGGSVEATSEGIGKGSEFIIRLPEHGPACELGPPS
jgi:signal transduction histidine kinase